jgi:DNA polymerase/3'-5' exonuclease PolX
MAPHCIYFTGSKAHNIAIRCMAQKDGLKINEYGVFRDEKRIGVKRKHQCTLLSG